MKDISNFLEGLEKLAYQILTWFILIPKTLTKLIYDPGWAPHYVEKELRKEEMRFDDYFSPIILLLFVTLIPFAILTTFPEPGIKITGPTEGYPNKFLNFIARADFILVNSDRTIFEWYSVEANEQGREIGETENLYNEEYHVIGTDKIGNVLDYAWKEPNKIYKITAVAKNMIGETVFETYTNTHFLEILKEDLGIIKDGVEVKKVDVTVEDVSKNLKGELSIFAGLLFLSFPLIFTLFIRSTHRGVISGAAMKQVFYIQCYYFSPLFLVLFLSFVIKRYALVDNPTIGRHVLMYYTTIIANIAIILWFVFAETRFLTRYQATVSYLNALIKVIAAIILIISVIVFVGQIVKNEDVLRDSLWSVFILSILLTFCYSGIRWLRNRHRASLFAAQGSFDPDDPTQTQSEDQHYMTDRSS